MQFVAPTTPVEKCWQTEVLFHDGESFFAALLQGIAKAKRSIFLESYIFEADPLGKRVVEALCDAAGRGVTVRVLVDAIGSPGWSAAYAATLTCSGASYKIFHRLPWDRLSQSESLGHSTLGLMAKLRQLNRRNHRKLVVIDEQSAFAGSMNISAVHLAAGEKPGWRDTGVSVSGPAVAILETAMERAWAPMRKRFRKKLRPAWRDLSELARLNTSRRMRRMNYRDLKRRIRGATDSIWITTPYFVPSREILSGLIDAGRRGVDVRLLLPSHSDVFFMTWVGAAFHHELMKVGVIVYEYLPSVLHAKILIVDDWATVGSSNFNHRSLLHDLEVDIVITHRENRTELRNTFFDDIDRSRKLSADSWSARSLFARAVGRLLLLFRYWL